MMATGHHAEPYSASFPGLDKFKGRVVHSHSYKDHTGYEDKRVLIVGIGNSGGDIAVELGRIASQVRTVAFPNSKNNPYHFLTLRFLVIFNILRSTNYSAIAYIN